MITTTTINLDKNLGYKKLPKMIYQVIPLKGYEVISLKIIIFSVYSCTKSSFFAWKITLTVSIANFYLTNSLSTFYWHDFNNRAAILKRNFSKNVPFFNTKDRAETSRLESSLDALTPVNEATQTLLSFAAPLRI